MPDVPVRAAWIARDAITASGPDATTYLQGQLSQDLMGIPVAASAWSWILQPTGKVDALVRVTHLTDGDWLVDVDGGFGAAVLARLNRFKLRTKVDFNQRDWTCLAIRGPRIGEVPGATVVVSAFGGVDAFGPSGTLALPPGAELMDPAEVEVVRIRSGFPKMGAELTERTIPAETGLIDATVSFTKGCYTGQELVARIDSRGSNVPRHLAVLHLPGPLDPGTALLRDGEQVGTVTSSAFGGDEEGWIGLGYVRRSVDVPGSVADPDGSPVGVTAPPRLG